jgi:hypothetical protein
LIVTTENIEWVRNNASAVQDKKCEGSKEKKKQLAGTGVLMEEREDRVGT